jgi:hypothetical protein
MGMERQRLSGAEHFAGFERTRHPWHDPPKQALAKTFSRPSWTRGPVRFAFNRAAPATRRWSTAHGDVVELGSRGKRRALQGGRARAGNGMQTASSIVYCGALIAPAPARCRGQQRLCRGPAET